MARHPSNDALFMAQLRCARDRFLGIRNIDALLGADWYRYETIRRYGENECREHLRIEGGRLRTQLDDDSKSGREFGAARNRREVPLG